MANDQKPKRVKIRKRNNPKTTPKLLFSQKLCEARVLISGNDAPSGLELLNSLASATRNPTKRAKILLIIAESETRLSRHTEALAAFEKASQYAAQAADPSLTLLSGTGIIRSLLRSLRTEEAKIAATELLAKLNAAAAAYTKLEALTPDQLAEQGEIAVSARPPRLTVSLTKIANAFHQSGLVEEARTFLLKAIQISPNGASRARQLLAKIALASDQPELAERYAREALLMGRFQAKTISAWQLYIDARARQNKVPILEADVFDSFQQHARGRIAAAAALSITRVLRAHGDPMWSTIAAGSLNRITDPVIATEIEKIVHADAKLFDTEPPETTAARSLKFLRAEDTSAKELIAHAKSYVRFSFQANKQPNTDRVLRIASRRFPAEVTLAIHHTMALGAMMARQHDLARQWLLDLINAAAQQDQSEAWGKATWALARMESLLENNSDAAFWYMEVAAASTTPPRFKIQALLRGLKYLGRSGDTSSDIGQLTENIRTILNQTDDFRILLDAARQLALAGEDFSSLKTEAADRATALADQAIAAASPAAALADLEYLSRKSYWDLASYHVVIERWEKLSTNQKAEYQSTGGSLYYEYLSLVFLSLIGQDRTQEADDLASTIIDNNQATPEGYVILGSTYAEWMIRNGQQQKAFEFFEWIAKEAPTHRRAAVSHYWIALNHLKKGQLSKAKKCAVALRNCYNGRAGLLSEWETDASGVLILNGLVIDDNLDRTKIQYQDLFLSKRITAINKDITNLRL